MTGARILLAQYVARSRTTGMGAWAHQVADALARAGHQPLVWFAEDVDPVPVAGRRQFLVAPGRLGRRLVAERGSFDVAIVHEPSAGWYARARRADPSLPPVVVMCHNVESKVGRLMREAAADGVKRARVFPWSRLTGRLLRSPRTDGAIRMADAVVCLSQEDRRYLEERLRLPAGRITVMTNGVDAAHIVPRGPAPGAPRRVLFVGGWLDIKGRRVLPDLWKALHARRPDATLTLAGTGLSPALVLKDFEARVRDSLTVWPSLTRSEMDRLYASHQLLVMPSLSEGSPLVLLEAFAAGLPAVASERGGIPDILRDGVEGRLFDPFDPEAGAAELDRMMSDTETMLRMSEAARARARELTWDRSAAQLLSAVSSLLPPPKPR